MATADEGKSQKYAGSNPVMVTKIINIMNLNINDTGIITFGVGDTSKVKVVDVQTYPSTGLPTDYWFWYLDDETNRPLVHPDFDEKFPLPEGLMEMVFTKD